MDNDRAFEAMVGIKKALEGFKWFLDCGTLLGAVREQNIIKWDHDIDVGCLAEFRDRIEEVAEKLRKLGFNAHVYHAWEGNPDAKFIQFSFHAVPGHISFHWLKGRRSKHIDKLLTCPAETRLIRGVEFPVPHDPEDYLTKLYKNWKVPDKTDSAHKFQIKEMVEKKVDPVKVKDLTALRDEYSKRQYRKPYNCICRDRKKVIDKMIKCDEEEKK